MTTEVSMRQLQGAGPKFCIFMCGGRPSLSLSLSRSLSICLSLSSILKWKKKSPKHALNWKEEIFLSFSLSLFNPKMVKKERSKTCSQLKKRNISLSLSSILKWTKKNGPKHVDLQLKKRKNKDSTFILFECNHTRGFSNVLILF